MPRRRSRRRPRPSRDRTERELERARKELDALCDGAPTCLDEATSLVGLRALKRLSPSRWPVLMRAAVADIASGRVPVTLHEALRFGLGGYLAPPRDAPDAVKARRASAARLLRSVQDLPLDAIDERTLLVLEGQRRRAGGARTSRARDRRLLRRAVCWGQRARGRRPRVQATWEGARPPGGEEPERAPTDLATLLVLLDVVPDTLLRARIGLALGLRLLPSEQDRIRGEDYDPARGTLRVHPHRRGRPGPADPVVLRLPSWLVELVDHAGLDRRTGRDLWFPHRDDPSRPDTRAGERLRRVTRRLGFDGVTLGAVRRLGQAVARQAHGSRALVRGTPRSLGTEGILHGDTARIEEEQSALAVAWKRLDLPPVAPGHMPARAPRDCRPDEPETDAARARVRTLRRRAERAPVSRREDLDAQAVTARRLEEAREHRPPLVKALAVPSGTPGDVGAEAARRRLQQLEHEAVLSRQKLRKAEAELQTWRARGALLATYESAPRRGESAARDSAELVAVAVGSGVLGYAAGRAHADHEGVGISAGENDPLPVHRAGPDDDWGW